VLARLSSRETLHNFPARLRCKNGELRHVLINSNACFKNGEFHHTRCYTTDITEFKREELKNKTLIAKLQDHNTRLQWKTSGYRESSAIHAVINRSLKR
jgi:hypothetical protein